MNTVQVYRTDGTVLESVELPDAIFGIRPSQSAIYQTVKGYLMNQRQGIASTKSRAAVSGSGRKLYRQKGTGRARAGSIKSPLRAGGGVIFGPRSRAYRERIPRKIRRLALRSVLSLKARAGELVGVEDFSFPEPKTKRMIEVLENLGMSEGEKVLLLVSHIDPITMKSCLNIRGLRVTSAENLCTYEVLDAERMILARGGLERLKEVLAG